MRAVERRVRKLENKLRPGECPECRGHFVAQIQIVERIVRPGEPVEPYLDDKDPPPPTCPTCGREPDDTEITFVEIVRPAEEAAEPSHAE